MKRQKRFVDFFTVSVIAISLVFPVLIQNNVFASTTPDGSVDNPYEISDCEELQGMNEAPEAHYVLVNNIDCSGTESWDDGKGFAPIGGTDFMYEAFVGSLDGRGYTISDLYIDRPDEMSVGLFGSVAVGTVGNFDLTGSVRGNLLVGSVAGSVILEGTVSNVAATVVVAGDNNGEFELGLPLSGVGGIAGFVFYGGVVERSSVYGYIETDYSDEAVGNFGGGLVGLIMDQGVLRDSHAHVLTGSYGDNSAVGGAVGAMLVYISDDLPLVENIYARGTVYVNENNLAGGLVGAAQGAAIKNSFAVTEFDIEEEAEDTADVGGLIGFGGSLELERNFYALDPAGLDCIDGLEDPDCMIVDTQEDPDYFFNNTINPPLDAWNFETIWITQASSYPILNRTIVEPTPDPDPEPSTPAPSTPPAKILENLPKNDSQISSLFTGDDRGVYNPSTIISLDDFGIYLEGGKYELSNLEEGQVITFKIIVNGVEELHTITIKEIGSYYVVLTIASDPFDIRLNLGEEKTVALGGKDIMTIQLSAITGEQVSLAFTKLSESASTPNNVASTQQPTANESSKNTNFWLLAAPGILLLAMIYKVILRNKKKRPQA